MLSKPNAKREETVIIRILRGFYYILPVFFLIVLSMVLSSYFPEIKYYGNVHFIISVFMVLSLVMLVFLSLSMEGKNKYVQFYLNAAFFLIVEMIIQSTGGLNSGFYPLLYLLIMTYVWRSSLKTALFFLTLIILTESVIMLGSDSATSYPVVFNLHLSFYLAFFLVFYVAFSHEKKEKNHYKHLVKTYEGGLNEGDDALGQDNKGLDISALSEQGRKRYDISITQKLNDKIFEILQKLKEIMHPFTVMYLELDNAGEKFFIKEVISDSDHINYTLEVNKDSGYFGWVAKNRRTININNYDGTVPDTFYYTTDEIIKSLIMVPALEEGRVKGVLLADSREFQYFTPKEENIMHLIAYQVMQEIDHFKIMWKVEYSAKESAVLNQVGKRLNVSLDLNETINVTLSSIKDLINPDLVAIAFLTDDESTGEINRVAGDKYKHLERKTFNIAAGICGNVIKKRRRVYYKDFSSVASKYSIFDKNLKLKDIKTFIMLPLISNDISFGVVLVANKTPFDISSYTAKTIETIVNQSAISIANARMFLRVEMMATTDGLTGLFNHKCFQDRMAEEMERLSRFPDNISVLLMDIDHFKTFNDTYGHPVGDKVLKIVADIFANSLRKVDFAARYGGEEFVAILVNTDKNGGIKMAERIRQEIERKRIKIGDELVDITVSLGISTFPEDSQDKKGLINLADKALYFAKENGRNRTIHHQDIVKMS